MVILEVLDIHLILTIRVIHHILIIHLQDQDLGVCMEVDLMVIQDKICNNNQ